MTHEEKLLAIWIILAAGMVLTAIGGVQMVRSAWEMML